MNGDSPDLKQLVQFCKKEGFHLIVDEAHATGVLGKRGVGLVQELKLEKLLFARIITFGKALGCHGAAILGSEKLKDYLINFSRSLIYTTALPPHSIATVLCAYECLDGIEGNLEMRKLLDNIYHFKSKLEALNLKQYFITSDSAIQSCIVSGNEKVKSISKKLEDKGFDVKAILSPTVTEGKERLRFCLHSYNSKDEIGLVLQLLKSYL